MPSQSPLMDDRRFDDILSELRSSAESHIPQWQSGDQSDPGIMLQHTFGRLMEIVIERINKVPEKQKLAFLDAMNISPLPPVPARAPVVFTLRKDAMPLSIPHGAGISAKAAGGGPPVVFETTDELIVLPMSITCAYALEPKRNRYGDYTERLDGAGFTPFIGEHDISDVYYFIEDVALSIERPKDITLTFRFGRGVDGAIIINFLDRVTWSYSDSDELVSFVPAHKSAEITDIKYDEFSFELSRDGAPSVLPTPSEHLGGGREPQPGRYLKCTLNDGLEAKEAADNLPLAATCMKVKSYESIPEHLFAQNARLNPDSYFLPFGNQPQEGDSFYIHMGDLFDTPNATVSVEIQSSVDLDKSNEIKNLWNSLVWYYSTQDDWKPYTRTENLLKCNGKTISMEVPRPPDAAPRKVNGSAGCWLRAVLPPGNYTLKEEPLFVRANSIHLSMSCEAPCRAYRQRGHIYTPLGKAMPSDETHPELKKTAFYLGFNSFFEHQPASLYADAEAVSDDLALTKDDNITWEYLTQDDSQHIWRPLFICDDTAGLTRSGLVRFLTPPNAACTELFDNTARYWVRVAQENNRKLHGIYLNAVPAEHATTVKREALGISNGYATQHFMLRGTPVLLEQHIWVCESEAPTAAELSETSVEMRQNAITLEQEKWVLWHEQNSFGASQSNSRHYTLDRTTGEISFGNGIRGMIPEKGAAIVADYRFGGGVRGNLPAKAIAKLTASLTEIEHVYNPIPSTGGAQPEDAQSILTRGPMVLRHRMRGVTSQDIEWLVKEVAGASIERIKCLQGDMECPFTLILLPAIDGKRPLPDGALTSRIRNYLAERIPAALGQIDFRIIGPRYVTVGVSVSVIPTNPLDSSIIRERATECLRTFLHPRFGGQDGAGWEFGRNVYPSEICAVLEAIDGVKHTLAGTVSIHPSAVQREFTLRTNDARLEECYPVGSLVSIRGLNGNVMEQWLLAETITSDILPKTIRVTGIREGDTLNITFPLYYNATQKEFRNTPSIDFPSGSVVRFENGVMATLLSNLHEGGTFTQNMLKAISTKKIVDNEVVTLIHPDTLKVTALQEDAFGGYTVTAHCSSNAFKLDYGVVLECAQSKVKANLVIDSPPSEDNTLTMRFKRCELPSGATLAQQDDEADAVEIKITDVKTITDIAYLTEHELCTPGAIDIIIAK